ncbi:myb-binding protein 1A [Prorops nasuta]|uniref:myb-binding protein 1A n=1 Tax=Prorops nasuta TaxID=863751 RepID=UPI0034CDCD98
MKAVKAHVNGNGVLYSENLKKVGKMEISVLDCFSKLSHEKETARFDAGISLIRHLNQLTIPDINNEAEAELNKELKYALTRIIRSLGSSKLFSKKGHYVTLTGFLTLYPMFPVEKILTIMDEELHPVNSNPKSENADIYLGRILVCGALIRSKIVGKCTVDLQLRIIDYLINAGNQRSYLSSVSTSFLIDFLNNTDGKSLSISVFSVIEKEIGKPWKEQTLDTFYLLLFMEEKFPSLVNHNFILNKIGTDDLISTESMEYVLGVLTDLPRIKSYQHPVFKLFCEKLIKAELVNEFWTGMDIRFKKPSRTDEYLAIEILKLLLPNITKKAILPQLLSPNFLAYMLKKFLYCRKKHTDEILHGFKEFLTILVSVINSDDIKPKYKIAVLKKLMLDPGDLMIERRTGTKVVQRITSSLNMECVKKLSKIYCNIIENSEPKLKGGNPEPWTNAERTYAAQLLTKLLTHPNILSDREWRLSQLKFLFKCGICDVSNIGVELAPHIKECFYRALDHKLPKLSDLRNLLSELVHYLRAEISSDDLKLRTPLSNEATEAWKKVICLIEALEKTKKNTQAIPIFHTMSLHMGLQLFSDTEMAITSINELESCYQRVTKNIQKKNKDNESKSKVEDKEKEEPKWAEVVVDLLLSLLSRTSHLLRSLVNCVFPHVCSHLTNAAIYQILEILDVKTDKNPLSIKSDEPESMDEDEESDESENDIAENGVETSEVSEDDSDSDSENNQTDFEEDETVNDRLRMAVQQALGEASFQTDDEDIDIDQIDEVEGKRLDESLAAAFRILKENRQNRSKKQEKSSQALTHFRVRVIDLLESYLESSPPMAIVFDILVSLFALLEFCIKDHHQNPLENRVRACLKKLAGIKKFNNVEGVDDELLINTLKIVIEKGERSAFICQEMGDKLAECCIFLIRCSQQTNLSNETLVNVMGENLTNFFKKRDCILPASLFKNLLQLCWVGNWELAPLLVNFAFDSSIRSFRRGQALEFLTIFYRNSRLIQTDETHMKIRKKVEKQLCHNSVNCFKELLIAHKTETSSNNEAGKEVKQKFVYLLLTLLHTVHPQHLKDAWNWQKIADAIMEYRANVSLAKDSRTAYNKLTAQIGFSIKPAKKRKISEPKVNGKSQAKESLNNELDTPPMSEGLLTSTKKRKKENGKR